MKRSIDRRNSARDRRNNRPPHSLCLAVHDSDSARFERVANRVARSVVTGCTRGAASLDLRSDVGLGEACASKSRRTQRCQLRRGSAAVRQAQRIHRIAQR